MNLIGQIAELIDDNPNVRVTIHSFNGNGIERYAVDISEQREGTNDLLIAREIVPVERNRPLQTALATALDFAKSEMEDRVAKAEEQWAKEVARKFSPTVTYTAHVWGCEKWTQLDSFTSNVTPAVADHIIESFRSSDDVVSAPEDREVTCYKRHPETGRAVVKLVFIYPTSAEVPA